MRINTSQKILSGYLAGFLLLLALAGLTISNGRGIEETTRSLAQQKLPGLIAVTNLRSGLQIQKNRLYELYATSDRATFDKRYRLDVEAMGRQVQLAQKLPEYPRHVKSLQAMMERQQALASSFSATMGAAEVDWDRAREGLAQFSAAADAMDAELDRLVHEVEAGTLERAETSVRMTGQLIDASLAVTGLIFLGVWVMVYFTTRYVTRPLKSMSTALVDIAANRDLTRRLEKTADDEVGDIAAAANNLLAEFQKLAGMLDRTALELGATVETLNGVTEATRASVLGQNAQLIAADGAAEEIVSQVGVIADKAGLAATEALESSRASEQGREVVISSRSTIAGLAQDVETTSGVIARLQEDSQQVSGVLAIIRDIAGQTNLLALNAAIEAARAGESGRGFAVVADEVRKLSQSTGNATTEIDQIMANLRQVVADAARLMQQARIQADASVEVANDAESRLHAIQDAAQRILMMNREIDTVVTGEHLAHVRAIRARMGEISASASTTERNINTLQGAAAELGSLAENLRKQISLIRF